MESIDGSVSRKPSGSSTKSLAHSPSETGSRKLPPPTLGVSMNGALAPMVSTWQPPRPRQVTVPHPASGALDLSENAGSSVVRRVTTSQLEEDKARKGRFQSPSYPSIRGPSAVPPVIESDTAASKAVEDLALGLRGLQMSEGHEAIVIQTRVPPPIQIPPPSATYHLPAGLTTSSTIMSPTIPPHRIGFPYAGQPDMGAYYPGSPLMEGYSDRFMFPTYDSYRAPSDPNLYAVAQTGVGRVFQSPQMGSLQSPILDARSTPQFYYTPGNQPFMYPPTPMSHTMVFSPSPMHSHLSLINHPAALARQNQEIQNRQGMVTQIRQPSSQQGMSNQRFVSPHPYQPLFPAPMANGMSMANASVFMNQSQSEQLMPLPPQPWVTGPRATRKPDFGSGVRSPLLEDFRVNKNKRWELKNIVDHIVEFSSDQHGSRFIQQKLENAPLEEKQLVFQEVLPDGAVPLMTDVFGNYVVQKLLEYGNPAQRDILYDAMRGSVVALSLQMYGCRVVQKAIEVITPEQQAVFVAEVSKEIMRLVEDSNGNHVVQKLIEVVSPDKLTFAETFKGNVLRLSTHPFGCRVLQRCFEHLTEEQTRPLLDEVHEHCSNLMQDKFGNYVVQFVLLHGQPQDKAQVLGKLRGHMHRLSRDKFASNVCDKALLTADAETKRQLIDELMTPTSDYSSPIASMMRDSFANYVLQKALVAAEGEQLNLLASKIRPHLAAMRRYSSGAHTKHLAAIEKLLDERCPLPPPPKAYHITNGIAMVA